MTANPNDCGHSRNAADEILGPALWSGRGDDVAILCGDAAVTFSELNAEANRFGSALRPRLERGDRALLLLKDSPVFAAAFLGIIRIGAVAVPVNARASARDVAYIVEDSGADVLLIDDEFLPLYREAAAMLRRTPSVIAVRGVAVAGTIGVDELLRDAPSHLVSQVIQPDDPAFWLYTSGTTGAPKAAVHWHADVVAGDEYMRWFSIAPGDRIFSSSKLFFAFGLAHTLIGGLRFGASIILFEGHPTSASVASIADRYRPTVMLSVPTMYRKLLRDGVSTQPCFKGVRHYISAGEALPERLYNAWLNNTGVAIVEGLGTTETIFMMISGTPEGHRAGATGKPVPYAEVRLIDEKGEAVTAADTPGVLHVKAGSVCHGYWHRPEETRRAWRDGWFRTGDVFTIDRDGWWHHQGREDDLLKISGQWVNPLEVEECAATVAGVVGAGAVGIRDPGGLMRLALFVVPESAGDPALEDAIRSKLLSTLSVYKCPRTILFVPAGGIPRTTTGKMQRNRLREIAVDRLAAEPS